ncbi:hypothetical protein F4604DRAFT_1943405 [Suillus subluteus]|nr:hypothetical protein F4604DRAFT_1943405 [Suillus subluteus]
MVLTSTDVNNAATETRSSNADATDTLPTRPSPPSPILRDSVDLVPDNIVRAESQSALVQEEGELATEPSMKPHDANLRPDIVHADGRMYGPRQGSRMEPRYPPQGPGRSFPRYPPSDYQRGYYDPRMQHGPLPAPPHGPQAPRGPQPLQPSRGPQPPQPSRGSQPPRGPQPGYHNSGYHDAPYRNSHDGFEGYVESYWHPPSSLYFGPGGRYEHGYGREYPNEYPEDQEEGGLAP